MKTRIGFVSNSSSTSFVVLLPEGLQIDWSEHEEIIDKEETEKETVERAFSELTKGNELWQEEYYSEIYVLREALSKYIIATFDVPSDCGIMMPANKNKIKEILSIPQ